MKKPIVKLLFVALVLLGGFVWVLRSADVKNLSRQDIVVDVADTFEK